MGVAEPWLVAVLTDLYERISAGGFGTLTATVASVSGQTPTVYRGIH